MPIKRRRALQIYKSCASEGYIFCRLLFYIKFIKVISHPESEDTMASKTNQKEAPKIEEYAEDEVVEDINQVFEDADLDSLRDD